MTPAIAFQAKDNTSRYLANGPELVDHSNKRGDTTEITDAVLIHRLDYKPPMKEDVEQFYQMMNEVPNVDVQAIKENYIPVYVQLTDLQMAEVEERNEM